jgi:hypothetical protein
MGDVFLDFGNVSFLIAKIRLRITCVTQCRCHCVIRFWQTSHANVYIYI